MDEIENLKDRIRELEKNYFNFSVSLSEKLYRLEKIINRLTIMTSFSFLIVFLMIGRIAKYI